MGSHAVAALRRSDDALEKEGIRDANDIRLGRPTIDPDALEVGLHGHVRLNNASIWDWTDQVKKGRHCLAGKLW